MTSITLSKSLNVNIIIEESQIIPRFRDLITGRIIDSLSMEGFSF